MCVFYLCQCIFNGKLIYASLVKDKFGGGQETNFLTSQKLELPNLELYTNRKLVDFVAGGHGGHSQGQEAIGVSRASDWSLQP